MPLPLVWVYLAAQATPAFYKVNFAAEVGQRGTLAIMAW